MVLFIHKEQRVKVACFACVQFSGITTTFFGCGIRQVPTENDTSDLQPQQQRKANQNPCLLKAQKSIKDNKLKSGSPNYRVKF